MFSRRDVLATAAAGAAMTTTAAAAGTFGNPDGEVRRVRLGAMAQTFSRRDGRGALERRPGRHPALADQPDRARLSYTAPV